MNRTARGVAWRLALASLATPSISLAAVQFTDWTSANLSGNTASGNLGGVAVSFSGGDLIVAFLAQEMTGFNSALYTPPLDSSDALEFRADSSGQSYVVHFGRLVRDPVIHLKSLASTLDFGDATVVKLSGESSLTVSGSTVSGVLDDTPNGHDSNGTIQLLGQFESVPFTATYVGVDGIDIQIGAVAPVVPGLSPTLGIVLGAVLGLLGIISLPIARRRAA